MKNVGRDGVAMGVVLRVRGNGKKEMQKTCFSAGQVTYIHYFKDIHYGRVCLMRVLPVIINFFNHN